MNRLVAFLLFSIFNSSYALVDYTDTVLEKPSRAGESKTQVERTQQKSSLIWKSDFSFSTKYEVSKVEDEKIGVLILNGHLQTPANVFFDLNYWSANNSKNNNGNPKFILGFNWFRIGNPNDEARVDIYGGARLKSQSELASSRNDKIFGAETIKRFGPFGIGIGYELSVSGVPARQEDVAIGNIHKISISSGWIVSNDIQFEFDFENYKISKSSLSDRTNFLDQDITFSSLSPKLNLQLFPAVSLELGARYRTNNPKSSKSLSSLKLLDAHGLYSNSIFTGVSFNL